MVPRIFLVYPARPACQVTGRQRKVLGFSRAHIYTSYFGVSQESLIATFSINKKIAIWVVSAWETSATSLNREFWGGLRFRAVADYPGQRAGGSTVLINTLTPSWAKDNRHQRVLDLAPSIFIGARRAVTSRSAPRDFSDVDVDTHSDVGCVPQAPVVLVLLVPYRL